VLWAAFLYLAHLFLQAWVASSEITAFFAMFFVAWSLYKGLLKPSFHILYFPLAIYGIASTASAFAAPYARHTFGENALWLKMLLFPSALILFREIPRLRQMALRTHIAFALFISCWGIFQYFALHERDLEHRITGPAAHVMTLSGLLLPTSLLLLVLALHERKVWLVGATAIVTLALLLTFTRSVWIGWIVAVFVLLSLIRPLWAFYAAIALLYFVIFSPIPVFSRLISTFDTKQESNLDRIRMAQAGVEIIKDYPLLGVGPANIKPNYPLYRKHDAPRFRIPHLHNNIIQIWAERGVLALAAYALLLCLFLRECGRAWRGPNRMYAEIGVVVAVGLAFAGLFEFNFGDTEVFWIMLDLYVLVIALIEPPLPDPLYGPARVSPDPANEPLPALVPAGERA
jgi:putative inorganic carbon (hco3(-)) transporter